MQINKKYIFSMGFAVSSLVSAAQPMQFELVTKSKPIEVDCGISPDVCLTAPVARGCGPGRHWSGAGSGKAHCVENDRTCENGRKNTRDELDKLVCEDEPKDSEKNGLPEKGSADPSSIESQMKGKIE